MIWDMEDMEASYLLYVNIGTFDQLEQSKVHSLTVTKIATVMLTVQPDIIFSLSFT